MTTKSRSPRRPGGRGPLLAGVAGAALFAVTGPVLAQDFAAIPTAPAAPAASDDGLGDSGFYLESDSLIQDDANQVVSAEGDVEVRYRGRTLRARSLIYDIRSGLITARGSVVVIDPSGAISFADEMVLDEEMRAGVARGFSARLDGDVKLAAATAVRRSDLVNELTQAIYTPCEICAEDKSRLPTWSIRADKVVQDREKQIIYYRNAVIEMWGVPVFYAPVFWHPDSSAKRKSGLLAPNVLASARRGLSYEQPYALIISPSEDLVISPQINTKVNPFLNLQWRKRFWSGQINARLGFTYERDLDGDGDRIGDLTSRSYVLANGAFRINEDWRWGFAAERASDDLIFDKYDVSDVYQQRGMLPSDDRRLSSQLYAVRQDERSWLSVSALSIQGLRPVDIDRAFPTIAPMIEGRWEPEGPVLGGRLRLQGSAVALTREQSQFVATQPGADSRRVSALADWQDTWTFKSGLRLSPFAQVRGDVYDLDDLPAPGPAARTVTRARGVAGVDVSFPLIRRDGARTIVLEPLFQAALSTRLFPMRTARSWSTTRPTCCGPTSSPASTGTRTGGASMWARGRASCTMTGAAGASWSAAPSARIRICSFRPEAACRPPGRTGSSPPRAAPSRASASSPAPGSARKTATCGASKQGSTSTPPAPAASSATCGTTRTSPASSARTSTSPVT